MRLRIATEPRETTIHPIDEDSPTITAQAVIENWDEVKDFVGNLAEVDANGDRVGSAGLSPRSETDPTGSEN